MALTLTEISKNGVQVGAVTHSAQLMYENRPQSDVFSAPSVDLAVDMAKARLDEIRVEIEPVFDLVYRDESQWWIKVID